MYFIGIGPCQSGTRSLAVVINVFLKNIKRHYDVTDIIFLPVPFSDPALKDHIFRLHQSNDHTVNKRIFSQDKRPTRNIRANPHLVISGAIGGREQAAALRAAKIPAECFHPRPEPGWEEIPFGRALGDDYHVGEADLVENMMTLTDQNRLRFASPDQAPIGELASSVASLNAHFRESGPGAAARRVAEMPEYDLPALLSLVLWFREKVPHKKSYKA